MNILIILLSVLIIFLIFRKKTIEHGPNIFNIIPRTLRVMRDISGIIGAYFRMQPELFYFMRRAKGIGLLAIKKMKYCYDVTYKTDYKHAKYTINVIKVTKKKAEKLLKISSKIMLTDPIKNMKKIRKLIGKFYNREIYDNYLIEKKVYNTIINPYKYYYLTHFEYFHFF